MKILLHLLINSESDKGVSLGFGVYELGTRVICGKCSEGTWSLFLEELGISEIRGEGLGITGF
jgi:hypothetical protein